MSDACSLRDLAKTSRQALTREGSKHPDRDAQFQYLDARMKEHMLEQSPVISVDTKKHALVKTGEGAGRRLQECRAGVASQSIT
jgi:hypothetical protein